ncbi:DUF3885 domain-containing protein [Microtetraspora fusca]|uniref:DUF3885 domain-containing protein n=1 Tax=Microtetraspora fusca TaxID=1997 RepID=A0ABW6UXG2_MICFU|nr:hypothetical protein [Microtetraspora fusca]
MFSDSELDPRALSRLWERQWPECPPFAHWLRDHYPDRWVRFHSLPDSKRYPDNEAEYAVVLDRHHTLLSELDPGADLLVITAEWTDTAATTPQRWPRRSQVAPSARHWRTLIEEPDDPEFRAYTQLYAELRPWRPGIIDAVLRAVADDEISGVILGPSDLRWLYHPYDGGADVILPTRSERDALKERHRTWLSKHPLGF